MRSEEDIGSDRAIRSYQDLLVFRKAMDLVDVVYEISGKFPQFEDFGLRSQMTRAAVSLITIAEGQARATSRDFANFLVIARSSVREAEALVLVAVRQKYVTEAAAAKALTLTDEVSRMLNSLRASVLRRSRRS